VNKTYSESAAATASAAALPLTSAQEIGWFTKEIKEFSSAFTSGTFFKDLR